MGILEGAVMGLTTMAVMIAYGLVGPFLIVYILEEIRGRRAGDRDPQLGAKLVSTLFLSVAFQVALMGLAAMLAGMVDERIGGETVSKNAMGLLCGGLAAGVLPLLIFRRVAGNGHTRIVRQAYGVNAVLTAAIGTFALVSSFLVLFNEGKVAALLAVDLVYLGAAALCVRPLLPPAPPPAG